jgi:hypothetical protein
MIVTRGPHQIPVIEPQAVPVDQIALELPNRKQLTGIAKRFNISVDEVNEAMNDYITRNDLNSSDYISFECDTLDGELNVTTTQVSPLMFLNALSYGSIFLPEDDFINNLYTKGVAEIIRECLQDIKADSTDYECSLIHKIMIDAFQRSYGSVDNQEAALLLLQMEDDFNDNA